MGGPLTFKVRGEQTNGALAVIRPGRDRRFTRGACTPPEAAATSSRPSIHNHGSSLRGNREPAEGPSRVTAAPDYRPPHKDMTHLLDAHLREMYRRRVRQIAKFADARRNSNAGLQPAVGVGRAPRLRSRRRHSSRTASSRRTVPNLAKRSREGTSSDARETSIVRSADQRVPSIPARQCPTGPQAMMEP